MHVKDLKAFHQIEKAADLIPGMPNYESFLKASNKPFPIAALLMKLLLRQNQLKNVSGILNACANMPEQENIQP